MMKESQKQKWDSQDWRSGMASASSKMCKSEAPWRVAGSWSETKSGPESSQQARLPIEEHRERILDHVRMHRVTFIQGGPGCGKSTAVPQFLLDDYPRHKRSTDKKVKVVVTQPRRIAAISLAQRVANLRKQRVGDEVGYCVGNDHKTGGDQTRLFYMTSGYLLDWLGHRWDKSRPLSDCMTYLILDEVHEKSREHDLLLLMVKKLLLLQKQGNGSRRSGYPKIIVMSATLEGTTFGDYFSVISGGNSMTNSNSTLFVGVNRFPVDVVFLEDIMSAMPDLSSKGVEIVNRLLKFPARGDFFPSFAYALVVHLVRHTVHVGDVVLVFVPGLMDIYNLQDAFAAAPSDPAHNTTNIVTFLLHSVLDKEEQDQVFDPPPPGAAKVVIATSIAESSITIPGVRFVIDTGMTKTMSYDKAVEIERLTCSWCCKASATQRAGRVGRLQPGTVIRLFTRATYEQFEEYAATPRHQTVGYSLMKLNSTFSEFGPARELIQQLMNPPEPHLVDDAIAELIHVGALVSTKPGCSGVVDMRLTPLGRLATRLSANVKAAKLLMLGLVMKCSPDCVVMVAGLQQDKNDIFHRFQGHQAQSDPLRFQKNLIDCFQAKKRFDDGHYSELLVYRQVYLEGQRCQYSRRWMEQNCISSSRFQLFLYTITRFANEIINFLQEHTLSEAMRMELNKLQVLARHGKSMYSNVRRTPVIFRNDLTMVKLAITAAFANQVIISNTAKSSCAVNEVQELEKAGLPPALSVKLRGVESTTPLDLPKLQNVLKVIAPRIVKILPSSQDQGSALIQCCGGILPKEAVVRDIPAAGLCLFHLPRVRSAKNTMTVRVPEPGGCREEQIGRPSKSRQLTWSTVLNGKTHKVKFDSGSVLEPAFETRSPEEIGYHIGVAHHFLGTHVTSTVIAHYVTILPPKNLFSVLALLLCWPPGEDDLELRMDIAGNRIYNLRIGTRLYLSLAPRYLILRQLDRIEEARIKICRLMAGEITDGNLEVDIQHILLPEGNMPHHHPVLSPELGPWLQYPSMRVSELSPKGTTTTCHRKEERGWQFKDGSVPQHAAATSEASSVNLVHGQRRRGIQVRTNPYNKPKTHTKKQQATVENTGLPPVTETLLPNSEEAEEKTSPAYGDHSTSTGTEKGSSKTSSTSEERTQILCTPRPVHEPLRIISRASHKSDDNTTMETTTTAGSIMSRDNNESDAEILLAAFQLADPSVETQILHDWLSGDKQHSRMFLSLLQKLTEASAQDPPDSHVYRALEILERERKTLFTKKQQPQVETLYHLCCNPDTSDRMSLSAWGTHPGQNVNTGRHASQCDARQPNAATITKQLKLTSRDRTLLLCKMKFHSDPSVTIFVPTVASKSSMVVVCGPPLQVQQALQWITSTVVDEKPGKWGIDKTYLDSEDLSKRIRFHKLSTCQKSCESGKIWIESVVQLDEELGQTSHVTAALQEIPQIAKDFVRASKKVSSDKKVELQASLGRVIFSHKNSESWSMPYETNQSLEDFVIALTKRKVSKQRFDDTIGLDEFSHLQAALSICRPKQLFRERTILIVVSSNVNQHSEEAHRKLTIVESGTRPGKFVLRSVQNIRKLATMDLVRLHARTMNTDLRISMMTREEQKITEKDQAFVDGMERNGALVTFPQVYPLIRIKRFKEAQVFLFDGIKVYLTQVSQARGTGDFRIKHEVDFEAVAPGESGPTSFVSTHDLARRINLLLTEVQNMCDFFRFSFNNSPIKTLAQRLLLHWKSEPNQTSGLRKLLNGMITQNSITDIKHDGSQNEIQLPDSKLICELLEHLRYHDDCITTKDNEVSSGLLFAVLKTLHMMGIRLVQGTHEQAWSLIASGELNPKIALMYSCLVPRHCYSKDYWEKVLGPYVWQLKLEQQNEEAKEIIALISLQGQPSETGARDLMHIVSHISLDQSFFSIRRLVHNQKATELMVLLAHILQQQNDTTQLLQEKIKAVLCQHDARTPELALECFSEWCLRDFDTTTEALNGKESTAGIILSAIHWLIEMIEMLHIPVTEECRVLALDQLIALAPVRAEAQDIEKRIFMNYEVDEALFRHRHYERIFESLTLQQMHKEELQRRGLTSDQCKIFKTLFPGHPVQSSCLIPGVNRHGDRLLGSPGILIPARDPTGQITGAQIKVNKVTSGKYIWWSSNKEGGKKPQLGDDLPLFCCVPQEDSCSVVGLCEGGLKSYVTAALIGLPIIGASGAAFPQSKNILETYLAMMNPKQIVFFPDAGSISNDQVSRSYFHTFRLLRGWNYHVLVAWWGQVNKEEHQDVDDLLCDSHSTHDIPLLSVRQFWGLLNVDVRNQLSEEFLEISKPWEVPILPPTWTDETFSDVDGVNITRPASSATESMKFLVSIPKSKMKKMPPQPNSYVTPASVHTFSIEAFMVWINNIQETDRLMDWLMQDEKHDQSIVGLDCEHGPDGALNLIQLSVHSRCLLIRIPCQASFHAYVVPERLSALLASRACIKTGAEVHKDALAIYNCLGLEVNGCKNVSHVHQISNKTSGMMTIFQSLYGWKWQKDQSVTCSDWGSDSLSLEQVKYAVLDAWTSRMIALEPPASEEGAIPLVSLGDFPREFLDLFGRAISHSQDLKDEKKVIEGAGNITTIGSGTLCLQQTWFPSRVLGPKSKVELIFKDGQEPEHYIATAREGKSVTLHRATDEASKTQSGKELKVDSISRIIVDNRMHSNMPKQKLEKALYDIISRKVQCPAQILLALQCRGKQHQEMVKTSSNLQSLEHICSSLNDSQKKAWTEILTSSLSATIGPPGTGKTQLIAAVAKAWNEIADKDEVLLCTAYQNVAARHIGETLVRQQVPGVMLLISQDYYTQWHENLYAEIEDNLIVSAAQSDLQGALHLWAGKNNRQTPRILVCTLSLIDCKSFISSLMSKKVTMMLVDECSQAAEGSILAPLTYLPDLRQVGVLGDPSQLTPYGGKLTAPCSIYDLMSRGCQAGLLDEQYRMPPAICDFISNEFYHRKLTTAPVRMQQKDYENPMLWVDVQGNTSFLPGKTSQKNEAEAEAIAKFCSQYAAMFTGTSGSEDDMNLGPDLGQNLVVLTIYEEQRQLISSLLTTAGLGFQVHNVDSFQGQEAEAILISLVVTDKFSYFAADPNRACVLLSRARKLMCVFGHFQKVINHPRAEIWQRLASHCQQHQLVVKPEGALAAIQGAVGSSSKGKACSVM